MKLQVNTDYAIQILHHLHKHGSVLHTAASISKSIEITYPNIIRIVNQLKQKGLLKAIQGRRCSYRLGRPAHEISLYDVFVCMEGELQAYSRHGDVRGLQEEMIKKMAGMSIATLELDDLARHTKQGLCDTAQVLEMQAERSYSVETADRGNHMIPVDEIMLIRSSPKQGMLELHREHDHFEFRGMISRIASDAPEFFRSHISVIVNINHIKDIDVEKREIVLTNGRVVPIAKQKIQALLHLTAAWAKAVG